MSPSFYGAHGMASETLASGAPIPQGGYFEMSEEDAEDPHNKRLIEEGKIIPISDKEIKSIQETAKKDEAAQKGETAVTTQDSGGDGGNSEDGEK